MEMFGIVIIVVIVAAWYGVFDMLEIGSRMGTRRLERLESEQVATDINYYENLELSEDKFKTATTKKAMVKKFAEL